MTIMKTYKYKLYTNKKNAQLNDAIDTAASIWNYCIAMHRAYYRLYGKSLSANKLKVHITKLKHRKRYAQWDTLGSQAIQDVVERVDKSYKAFFTHVKGNHFGRKSPPKFCKRTKYKSFTLKQSGYNFCKDNQVVIMGKSYKYCKARPMEGIIKTVTVKRTPLGELFLIVVCKQEIHYIIPRAGKAAGYDFGLKHFLTADDGSVIDSPQWYAASLNELRKAQRAVSRCQKGSNNRKRTVRQLVRLHTRIVNRRRDWFFKLANQIVADNAVICIEDLNLKAMQRLWGRKINDYAFAEFVSILEWVALKGGSTVIKIDRWAPSSKACHVCGTVHTELTLADRAWDCECCGTHHDRDVNAAINIKKMGLAAS